MTMHALTRVQGIYQCGAKARDGGRASGVRKQVTCQACLACSAERQAEAKARFAEVLSRAASQSPERTK